ncbi:MAG TPA: SWIB/MDM2 domain-containing protein [Longimicrobiales bacterium]|nr:SWIB/MDM2 domain-containing protein [Longimicrobiales bacterium]
MPAKKKSAKKSRAAARRPAAKKGARKAAKKSRRPAAKKAPAKKTAKKAAKKAARKRAPNPAFMRPMTPSAQLAAVVGGNAIPRSEVTKRVWNYIKSKGLQDKANKRMINADDKLGPVFGGKKQVSMFEMTKLVNKHLK